MDVVSAIAEDAGVSVDITDLRLSGDHAFKARPGCRAHQMSFARQYSKSHCNTERQVKSQRSKVKSRAIREVCWCSGRVRLRRMSISAWSSKIQPMPTLAKLQLQLQLLPL